MRATTETLIYNNKIFQAKVFTSPKHILIILPDNSRHISIFAPLQPQRLAQLKLLRFAISQYAIEPSPPNTPAI